MKSSLFTGIVEEIGTVSNIIKGEKSIKLSLQCSKILEDTKLGDSISVNGICLTVTHLSKGAFTADVMPETLRSTNLGQLKIGYKVNLERAMSPQNRFGGHIVSGHIDGTGTITHIDKEDNAVWFTIQAAGEILKYIIHKGSISVDGISLTVQHVDRLQFKVSVIPHTRDYTILPMKKVGDIVNLECDIVGKYIERLMNFKSEGTDDKITLDYLIENGF